MVVLEPGVAIPEGTVVTVEPLAEPVETSPADDDLSKMGDLATETGIADLSVNIDHYLYGHPKIDKAH